MELNSIIIKPYHTEKSYGLRKFQDPSCLCFVVDKRANKTEIKNAFYSLYNVVPEKINILVRKPKKLRYTTNGIGYSKTTKLAYIILPKGVQVALTKDEIEEANAASSENKEVSETKKTSKEKAKKQEKSEASEDASKAKDTTEK